MITADIQLTAAFNRGLAALIHDAGLNAQTVVAKETGELIKTLVRLSPQAAPAKIKDDITRRFATLSQEHPAHKFVGTGKGDVDWYAVSSVSLHGVKKEMDMRKASVADLKSLLYKTERKGRIVGFRGKQKVYILQRILTKASTVAKLAALKAKNRGRLRAGWLVATTKGPIKLTGANMPPAWVTRHNSGAKGSFIDGLGNKKFPSFTISNTAKGIGQKAVDGIVKSALKIRASAMAKNALLFMKNRKNVADYK